MKKLGEDQVVGQLLDIYQRICPEPSGVWPCDLGAPVLAWLCDQLGVERKLRSGLYHHPDQDSYNKTMGYAPGSDDWATWTDEYHCWIECDRPYAKLLIDSNPGRLPGDEQPQVMLHRSSEFTGEAFDYDPGTDSWEASAFEPCNDARIDGVGYQSDQNIEKLAAALKHDLRLAQALDAAGKILSSDNR